jgi:hypothetical protein
VGHAKRIGRWIAFLPGAFVGAALAGGITKIFFRYADPLLLDPDGWSARLILESASGAAIGAAFVYIGTAIAPAGRQRVCFALAITGISIAAVALLANAITANYWGVWQSICVGCGAAVGIQAARDGELFAAATVPRGSDGSG